MFFFLVFMTSLLSVSFAISRMTSFFWGGGGGVSMEAFHQQFYCTRNKNKITIHDAHHVMEFLAATKMSSAVPRIKRPLRTESRRRGIWPTIVHCCINVADNLAQILLFLQPLLFLHWGGGGGGGREKQMLFSHIHNHITITCWIRK